MFDLPGAFATRQGIALVEIGCYNVVVASSLAYDNYDILITAAEQIRAESPTEGEVGPERFDLDQNEIELALALVRRGSAPSELQRQLGETLYRALFPPPIRAHFERSRARASERRQRIRLHIESPRLAALPWELLYDGDCFLGLSSRVSIVRYPAGARPADSLGIAAPLRVLVAISSPDNYPDLNRETYAERLKDVFSALQASGAIEVEFLLRATCAGLIRRLRGGTFHVLHVLGYTALDSETRQAALLLEEENGLARRITGRNFASMLIREDIERTVGRDWALRLIVLNECHAAAGTTPGYALQLASDIAEAGVPALVATQYPLTLDDTTAFAGEFYGAIARGLPLDLAVTLGRAGIAGFTAIEEPANHAVTVGERATTGEEALPAVSSAEWTAPALVLRADDSQLIAPRQAETISFNRSLEAVYARVDEFKVVTQDRITRFFLCHLRTITIIAVIALLVHGLSVQRFDSLLVSAVLTALWCIKLLRDLFSRRLPETLRTLWIRRLIVARETEEPLEAYLAYLEEYNALLNHPRFIRVPQALGVAVAVITLAMLDFRGIPEPLVLPLQGVIFVLAPLGGYVLGTLLWKMIATMIATRRLSYRFELDVRPTHPDGCGGLKPLGDLYFEQARILLVAGLFFAAWVTILTLSHTTLLHHVTAVAPQQAALIADYPRLCAGNASAADNDGAAILPQVCRRLATYAEAGDAPGIAAMPEYLTLRALFATVTQPPLPLSLDLAYTLHRYYRWLPLYRALLILIAIIAIITFVFPMYNAHRIMRDRRPHFRHRADSISREITELERYIERYGAGGDDNGSQVVVRLEWLNDQYVRYSRPPLWPFDVSVQRRLIASLGSMALSLGFSELLPALVPLVTRALL